MERYIGMDVHAASCTLAVISEKGRKLRDFPVETNGQALVEAIQVCSALLERRAELRPPRGRQRVVLDAEGVGAAALRISESRSEDDIPEQEVAAVVVVCLGEFGGVVPAVHLGAVDDFL